MSTVAARIASIAARWITIEEAGKALTMKAEAVRRLILSGDIYGVKVGKEWRVDLESIEARLESKRAAAKVAFLNLKK